MKTDPKLLHEDNHKFLNGRIASPVNEDEIFHNLMRLQNDNRLRFVRLNYLRYMFIYVVGCLFVLVLMFDFGIHAVQKLPNSLADWGIALVVSAIFITFLGIFGYWFRHYSQRFKQVNSILRLDTDELYRVLMREGVNITGRVAEKTLTEKGVQIKFRVPKSRLLQTYTTTNALDLQERDAIMVLSLPLANQYFFNVVL